MLLKNKKTNTGNISVQFQQFKNEIISSGKNPQTILNELIASGKVTQEDVNKATKMAKSLMNLL